MASVRRHDVDARRASDVNFLPLSDKRPSEEPMISSHSQQLLLAPMDQAPSSEKAIWLYEAGHMPDNIARIFGRSELELLLRVLNRELVETQIFLDAALHAPNVEWDEFQASERRLRMVLGVMFLVVALLAVAGAVADIAPLLRVACALIVELGISYVLFYYRNGSLYWSRDRPLLIGPLVLGVPLLVLGREVVGNTWVARFMVSAGATLVAWVMPLGPAIGAALMTLHPQAQQWSFELSKRVVDEDPAATVDPALLDLKKSANSSPGKYLRPEWRVPILFATCQDEDENISVFARDRISHVINYVMNRAMTIHPELLLSLEEFTCPVRVAGGSIALSTLPVIRVCENTRPVDANRCSPKRTFWTPFSAFVHHASQPDAETGESLVDVDMMHARRRAFLRLHGMEGGAVPTERALPPMGAAVEEMVRQHCRPLSSALGRNRQNAVPSSDADPGESLWDGEGGFGGAMGQYNPLVGGAAEEEAAKKKIAGEDSGTAGPHVV